MATEEKEVPSKNPPDWRDWVNEFPSIKSIALTCVISWILTPLAMMAAGAIAAAGLITDQKTLDFIVRLISTWLDALNWLTLAAVFGVVTKRATEKPDVIRAEGEVEAAKIAAQAQGIPQPVGKPHPATDPAIVDAIDTVTGAQRDWIAQLQAENKAKLARQSGTQFEREEG